MRVTSPATVTFNLRKILLISLVWSGTYSYAQNNCSCGSNEKELNTQFNTFVDSEKTNEALELANSLLQKNDPSCNALGLMMLSDLQNDPDSVKYYLDQQLPLLKKISCNKKAKLDYHSKLSQYYFSQSKEEEGVKELLQGIVIAEELKDYEQSALLYSNLSIAFSRLGEADKMLLYAQKMLGVTNKINSLPTRIDRLANAATSYNSYYWETEKPGYEDTVFALALEVVKLSKTIDYRNGLINGYNLLHNKPYSQKQFQRSMAYLDSALRIINLPGTEGSVYKRYSIYSKKSDIYLELLDYKNAISCTDSLLLYAQQLKQSNLLFSGYRRKYLAYKAAGDYKNAFTFSEKFFLLKDSVVSAARSETINELEQKYNKAKNEKTITELSQEKNLLLQKEEISGLKINLLIIGIVLCIVLIVLVYYIYRQRNLRQQQLILQTEQRLNRSRINPHFFFNALGSLQGMAVKENDGKKVAMNLFAFSKLMRQTLESTYNELHTITTEIEFLEHYLQLEKLKSGEKFSHAITVDETIDPQDILIPSMILQPFVENAIEHGFRGMEHGSELKIYISAKNKELFISIQDNGKGMSKEKDAGKEHISRATQITNDRLFLLNLQKGTKARFTSGPIKESGFLVELFLPLLSKHESTGN